MPDQLLYVYTNRFPYSGGEPFLETEIHFLAAQFKAVVLVPAETGQTYAIELPVNVSVLQIPRTPSVPLRSLILKHVRLLCKWWLKALFRSSHRFKYLKEFRFNFNRMMGLISEARDLQHYFIDKPEKAVHYSYWFNEWGSKLAMAKYMGLKGRFVVRTHGYDFDEQQQGRGYFPFRETEITAFDSVSQVSAYGFSYIQKRFPALQNINTHYLGVSENGMNPVSETLPYQIVSCSNFVELKRLPLLIQILAAIQVPFHWTHFGGGKGFDEIKAVATLKLKSGSFEFKGPVPNRAVLEYYRNHSVDLIINTSRLEGLPVSLMEAISSGIPVAGCNICGIPEIVSEQTGFLLEANPDPQIAAGQITHFLQHKSRNSDFRTGVKYYWEQHFHAEKNYNRFISEVLKA